MASLHPVINELIDQLVEEHHQITDSRFVILDNLASSIRNELRSKKKVRLNFICTHNSRRSQIAQIWAHTSATAFQVPGVEAISGGTEATAFNPNAVRAMRTLGFKVDLVDHLGSEEIHGSANHQGTVDHQGSADHQGPADHQGSAEHQGTVDNPRYNIGIGPGLPGLVCYSKRYEEAISGKPFIAVMTCSDADRNCPVVPGATARIPLTYEDPKVSDGTEGQPLAYLKTALEIGRELIWVFQRV